VALGASSGAASHQSSSATREEVQYASGSLQLRGVIFTPDSSERHPTVVFLHGLSGASDEVAATIGDVFARNGYVLFFPFRRGLGPSVGQGTAIGPTLDAEEKARGIDASMRLTARLLETDQLEDVRAAVEYVRTRRDVDPSRVAVFGSAFGGMLSVLAAERVPHIKASISANPGGQAWARNAEIRDLLRQSVRKAAVPIFFFQGANDIDLTPAQELAAEMGRAGKPVVRKIYRGDGQKSNDGHTIAGSAPELWEKDVLEFLKQHLDTSAR
jgi:dienelactone hydrolase